jgi:hypothetical protein
MANYSSTRLQRGYVTKEITWGQAVAPSNGDAFLFTDLTMDDIQTVEDRPDKTGSLSRVVGQRTRRNGTWSMKASLANGGTVPDIDAFLESLMGKPAAGSTYQPEDLDPSMTIWDFNRPSGMNQRCAPGSIVLGMQISFGKTFADVSFNGECKCVLGSKTFSVESDEAKSGLGSFPAEPSSPTVVGATLASVVTGYKGIITLAGQEFTSIRDGQLEIKVERELKKDSWNNDLPTGIMSGVRTASIPRVTMDDDDSTELATLIANAYSGTAVVDFGFQLGKVVGGIYTLTYRNIVLPKPKYDYSQKRRGIVFENLQAAATDITSKDEVQIVVG